MDVNFDDLFDFSPEPLDAATIGQHADDLQQQQPEQPLSQSAPQHWTSDIQGLLQGLPNTTAQVRRKAIVP